jgi:uncharacterized protein YjgD (DUF1641 family)
MNPGAASTIEQVLFERMGMSVEDAMATGTDLLDEKVAAAAAHGINVDQRMESLGDLLAALTEPQTLEALQTLVAHLPQLARWASLADQLPGLLAMLGDTLDETAANLQEHGLDVERSLANGLQAVLWLGGQLEKDDLQRLGGVIKSDVLNPAAVQVVEQAASSLTAVQEHLRQVPGDQRVGLWGMLRALRDPDIQRSLAFATRFGKLFGRRLQDAAEAADSSA